jgi:hypothetical protein
MDTAVLTVEAAEVEYQLYLPVMLSAGAATDQEPQDFLPGWSFLLLPGLALGLTRFKRPKD